MKDKKNILIIALVVFLMGVGLPAVSMAVDVSTECAYTDTTFICEVYVVTGGVELRSGGVKLTYDTEKLYEPVATKNETDWYFGAGVAQHPYMDPDTTTPGTVVFIVGILNETLPAEGVAGDPTFTRAKVGEVSFTRRDTVNPVAGTPGAAQAAFFGITTDLGRVAPYVNFVDTAGAELDSAPVGFGQIVAQRGDANADGRVNISDVTAIRDIAFNTMPATIYADCDDSQSVNISDVTCIRDLVFQ